MTTKAFALALLAAAAALMPTVALAHTGHGAASGFLHGLAHPVGGLDHVLAMVMAGILAWQIGGRALWLVPLTFVSMMAIGGALGVAGMAVPAVELGIALSVVVLGTVVAFGAKAPLAVLLALVGVFAVFHGHAHGAELPADASGLGYGLGFLIATALLHLAGIGLGSAIGRIGQRTSPIAVRAVGGLVALAGVGVLTGLV
jgi:urease accessory protein